MHYFQDNKTIFNSKLLKWYHNSKRDLPWRNTKDPYKIWLSEIILQQTRVNQGLNYYLKFIDHYPTIKDLASASEEEILKDWQGLGYYSRARNLHSAAKFISLELNNQFPTSFKSIKGLKGVGDYTAAAIASFAYKLPHAVIDGNVYRVLSRIFGKQTPIDSVLGKKEFSVLANHLIDENQPDIYNQAIMEFGALQCTPKKPDCYNCIFQAECIAFKNESISDLPVKEKKIKQRHRYLNYLIIESADYIAINKRNKKDIWQNLYDFPLVETAHEIDLKQLQIEKGFEQISQAINLKFQAKSLNKKHILSHQKLNALFFHFITDDLKPLLAQNFELIHKQKLHEIPIPKLIENYLNEETNLLSLFKN